MEYPASAAERKQAQVPHNLFVSTLFLINLTMTPAVIALKLGMAGLLFTLFCSVSVQAYIYLRSRKPADWYVVAHWRLAWSHSRILLLGYSISAALILLAWLVSLTAHEASMGHIMWTAMTRIALVPTLIFVMVTAVMGANAVGVAGRGEVPEKISKIFPPPAN